MCVICFFFSFLRRSDNSSDHNGCRDAWAPTHLGIHGDPNTRTKNWAPGDLQTARSDDSAAGGRDRRPRLESSKWWLPSQKITAPPLRPFQSSTMVPSPTAAGEGEEDERAVGVDSSRPEEGTIR